MVNAKNDPAKAFCQWVNNRAFLCIINLPLTKMEWYCPAIHNE